MNATFLGWLLFSLAMLRLAGYRLEACESGFRERRNLRQQRIALGRRDRDGLDLAGIDEAFRCCATGERQVDLATDQVIDRRTRALVGNMHELGAGDRVEFLER